MPKPIKLTKADSKRFWSLVEKRGPNDCWHWKGSHVASGYPRYYSFTGFDYRAHRVACFLAYGNSGDMTCHTCNNPWCVNPRHLYPGDIHTNTDDKRKAETTPRGEANNKAKLSRKQVMEIVRLYNLDKTTSQIAQILGLHREIVYKVCSGRCWSWLTGISKNKPKSWREIAPCAKFTVAQVQEIALMYSQGKRPSEIAKYMGCNYRAVYNVCYGSSWSWLTGIKK